MDLQKTKQEVEDFLREEEILEQGVVRIEDNNYILTIVFKRIKSNYENMRALMDDRVRRAEREEEAQRMRSRLCEFVSLHP